LDKYLPKEAFKLFLNYDPKRVWLK